MFNFLRKPTIKARLVEGGAKAKVQLLNINKQQQVILIFMIIKQVAAGLGMDTRYVLNRLIDMDKGIVKQRKEEERQAKYGRKK